MCEYCPSLKNIIKIISEYPRTGSVALCLDNTTSSETRASLEAFLTWHIIEAQNKIFETEHKELLKIFKIENGIVLCLIENELTGLGVDSDKMNDLVSTLQDHIYEIEKHAYKLAGRHFSFTSSKDCAKVSVLISLKFLINLL